MNSKNTSNSQIVQCGGGSQRLFIKLRRGRSRKVVPTQVPASNHLILCHITCIEVRPHLFTRKLILLIMIIQLPDFITSNFYISENNGLQSLACIIHWVTEFPILPVVLMLYTYLKELHAISRKSSFPINKNVGCPTLGFPTICWSGDFEQVGFSKSTRRSQEITTDC